MLMHHHIKGSRIGHTTSYVWDFRSVLSTVISLWTPGAEALPINHVEGQARSHTQLELRCGHLFQQFCDQCPAGPIWPTISHHFVHCTLLAMAKIPPTPKLLSVTSFYTQTRGDTKEHQLGERFLAEFLAF